MTEATTIANLVMDKGGTNSHTIYATKIEEVYQKALRVFKPPQEKKDRPNGAKDTRVLDLAQKEIRFNVDGWVDKSSLTLIRSMMTIGGTYTLEYDSVDYVVNVDKYTIMRDATQQDEQKVKFTCIVAIDL